MISPFLKCIKSHSCLNFPIAAAGGCFMRRQNKSINYGFNYSWNKRWKIHALAFYSKLPRFLTTMTTMRGDNPYKFPHSHLVKAILYEKRNSQKVCREGGKKGDNNTREHKSITIKQFIFIFISSHKAHKAFLSTHDTTFQNLYDENCCKWRSVGTFELKCSL